MENSEDPDEIQHSLHCLQTQNRYSEKEIDYVLEIITCNPSIYTTPQYILT